MAPNTAAPAGTAKRSVVNVLWAYLSFTATKVLNLAAIVIVARYLDPAEFGLMAICLAIMMYFDILAQFGLGSALISARADVERTASAVLVCGLAMSTGLAVALWATSEAIAGFYGAPLLADLLDVTALALVIRSLTMVHSAFLFRELRLRAKVVPDVSRSLAKGIVSIVLAVTGFGVWSLVLGYVAGALTGSIALVIVRPWRPRAMPDLASIRYVMGYGSHLIGAETINAIPRIFDTLLIGKILGPAALGLYALAFRIPELGIKSFTTVTASVLHPMMALLQGDAGALRDYYYGALRYCALIMFGMGAALAILSDPLIRVLYAPKWYDMIAPMQLISIAFAISTLNMVPGNLLKAVQRTDLLFRVSLINLPFFVILIWLAVPYGIVAVAGAQVVLSVVRFVPTYWVTKRVTDINAGDTMTALVPGLWCAGAAGLVTLLVLQLVGAPLAQLMLGAATFGAVYLLILRSVAPEVVETALRAVARKRARRAAT